MCYTGSCPYEGRGGGCNLHHRYDAGRVPADAWCGEENFEEEEGMSLTPEEFALVLAYRAERARRQRESDEEDSK